MRWRRLFLRLGGALSEGLGIMCCYYCSLNMPVYAVLQYTRTHTHILSSSQFASRCQADLSQVLLTTSLLPHIVTKEERVQQRSGPLIAGEQDPTTKHRPPQPHRRPSPKALDPIIQHDAPERINRTRTPRTLTSRLNHIKRLRRQRRHHTSHTSIRKIRRRTLLNPLGTFIVLENIIRAHSKSRCARLFQRRACETTIHACQTVFEQNSFDAMSRVQEASLGSRVIDQCGFDSFRGRHGRGGGDDAAGHSREHVS